MKVVNALILVLSLPLLASCSSSPKKTVTAPAPTPAPSPTAPARTDRFPAGIKCTLDEDTRKIEINGQGEGCQVHYLKFGNSSVIASSASGFAHCESIRDRIRGKLEAAGFKCE